MRGRVAKWVAIVLAFGSTIGAAVACITGSGPGHPVTCTTKADQSCTCLPDSNGDSGTLCPASNAGSDMVCCSDFGYPTVSGSCRCSHVPVGCTNDTFGCRCGLVDVDASGTPSCTLPKTWPTCCKSGLSCACQLSSDCGDAGVAVSSCSSSDVGGGTCTVTDNACVCDYTIKDAATSCAPPDFKCCIIPGTLTNTTTCFCGIGPDACNNIGGATPVASCSADSVATAARHDLCGFSSVVVPTCNPTPDAGPL